MRGLRGSILNGVKVHVNESADLDDIKSALIERKPVLIIIRDGEHWVVVYGFSEVRLNLKCSLSYEEFIDCWDENWVAVVSNN